jgi:hypothetical protein
VLDLRTDLVASYKGHEARLTSLTPPSPEHRFVISGDARGGVRAWPLPARLARVAATSSSPFHAAIFDARSATVMATTWLPALTLYTPATGIRTVEPHLVDNIFLERSPGGRVFASYGLEDVIELWSAETMTRTRVIPTQHGSISQLRFADGSDDVITSGRDGRLMRWLPDGSRTLAQLDRPIDGFATTGAADSIVFSTADGALWRTSPDGPARSLRAAGARVNRLVAVPERQAIYAGYANGDLVAIDTASWQQQTVLHGSGAIQEIAAAGQTLAVATSAGTLHVATRGSSWATLAMRARRVALTPDGLLIASCNDGTVWLYAPATRRWLCLPTGTVDLGAPAVTGDGRAAVVPDFEGRLLWIDLEAAHQLLDLPNQSPPRIDKGP